MFKFKLLQIKIKNIEMCLPKLLSSGILNKCKWKCPRQTARAKDLGEKIPNPQHLKIPKRLFSIDCSVE